MRTTRPDVTVRSPLALTAKSSSGIGVVLVLVVVLKHFLTLFPGFQMDGRKSQIIIIRQRSWSEPRGNLTKPR